MGVPARVRRSTVRRSCATVGLLAIVLTSGCAAVRGTGVREDAAGRARGYPLPSMFPVPPGPAALLPELRRITPPRGRQVDGVHTVTVVADGSGLRVPAGFVGLSEEYTAFWKLAGENAGAPNPSLVRLLHRLAVAGNGMPVLRLGGNSQDRTWWSGAGAAPPGTQHVVTPSELAVLAAVLRDGGLRARVGLNLAANRPDEARAFARAVARTVPNGELAGLEIGNEPNVYGREGFRPRSYTFAGYLNDLGRYVAALHEAPAVAAPLAGPAGSSPLAWGRSADGRRIAATLGTRSTLTWHLYELSRCARPGDFGYPTLPRLLRQRRLVAALAPFRPIVAEGRADGVPIRLGEANSVGCSGRPGVSDTFGAALWTTDLLFHALAIGLNGVDLHGAAGASYSPLLPGPDGAIRVMPAYYGILLFAHAAPAGARLDRVMGHGSGVAAFATTDAAGVTRTVLLNMQHRRVTVRLRLPAGAAAVLDRLTAPSLSSGAGLRLDGTTFDGSPDGQPVGTFRRERVRMQAHTVDVTLPDAGAVMVTTG